MASQSQSTLGVRLYDPKMLIEEVKKRPVLWDKGYIEYGDKIGKSRAWTEITLEFNTNPDASGGELMELERELQKKWRNMRDVFIKDDRKRLSNRNKRKYIYYDDMIFLRSKNNNDDSDTRNDDDEETTGVRNDEESSDSHLVSNNTTNRVKLIKRKHLAQLSARRKFKRKTTTSSADEEQEDDGEEQEQEKEMSINNDDNNDEDLTFGNVKPEILTINSNSNPLNASYEMLEDDSERLFLLSLVKPLKQVPEHARLSVKMEIMRVLQNGILSEDML